MTHWRTARIASGEQPQSGPPRAADTHRDSNVIEFSRPVSSFRPNSRSSPSEFSIEDDEPPIHPFELGSHLLFLALLLLPIAVVSGVAIAYLTVIPQAVQYLGRGEADRLESHFRSH